MSTVYIWVALMGIIGIISLVLFANFYIHFFRMKKIQELPKNTMNFTWLLMVISLLSFSLTVYFILDIKEQLLQIM